MSIGITPVSGRRLGPERITATEVIDDVQYVVVLEQDEAGRYWETGLTPAERSACTAVCPVEPPPCTHVPSRPAACPEIREDKVDSIRAAIARDDYETEEKVDWTVDAVLRELEALMMAVEG